MTKKPVFELRFHRFVKLIAAANQEAVARFAERFGYTTNRIVPLSDFCITEHGGDRKADAHVDAAGSVITTKENFHGPAWEDFRLAIAGRLVGKASSLPGRNGCRRQKLTARFPSSGNS